MRSPTPVLGDPDPVLAPGSQFRRSQRPSCRPDLPPERPSHAALVKDGRRPPRLRPNRDRPARTAVSSADSCPRPSRRAAQPDLPDLDRTPWPGQPGGKPLTWLAFKCPLGHAANMRPKPLRTIVREVRTDAATSGSQVRPRIRRQGSQPDGLPPGAASGAALTVTAWSRRYSGSRRCRPLTTATRVTVAIAGPPGCRSQLRSSQRVARLSGTCARWSLMPHRCPHGPQAHGAGAGGISALGLRGITVIPAASITPGWVICPCTTTATFAAPCSAIVASALR